MPTVISDTSCLVFLGQVGQLDLLTALFDEGCLAPAAAAEYSLALANYLLIIDKEQPKQIATQST